jgi:cGMP-dependent protein kinase
MGGDVLKVIKKKKNLKERKDSLMKGCVVEEMKYINDRGFIYSDIKKENMMLDKKGYVKMIEFGFEKRVGESGKNWKFDGKNEYVENEIILKKGNERDVE